MPSHDLGTYEHCSPCFLHMLLPVLQPSLQLHLIISINFIGAGGREVWMGSICPSLVFWSHSSGTSLLAQPSVLRLTMYSLTAYLQNRRLRSASRALFGSHKCNTLITI